MSSSGYHGRRGANVSHYLQGLNTIPDAVEEPLAHDDDLSLFTNTLFMDSETGNYTDYTPHPIKIDESAPSATVAAAAASEAASPVDAEGLESAGSAIPDFNNFFTHFNFPDFSAIQNISYHNGMPSLAPSHPAQPAHVYPGASAPVAVATAASAAAPPAVVPAPPSPPKRKASESVDDDSTFAPDENSQKAAEDDKRRRNTAASARFRVKKKMREQALEQTTKELSEKANALESRIAQLETENKWLKNLVMEKNEGKDEIISLIKSLNTASAVATSRSKKTAKDGP